MADLIQNIDYRLNGYHKKETFDTKGDLVILQYYADYDEQSEVYSNLKVQENRTYERDGVTTLLNKRTISIKWYSNAKEVASKTIIKYYSKTEGYQANKRSRTNLIDTASMYLVSQVGLDNAKSYLANVSADISTYIDGNITILIATIQSSSEPYLTEEIKGTLVTILNVPYSS